MEKVDPGRKLPIGVQSFASVRDDGYLYADKTDYVYRLINEGKQYFLSRPRRFGKSLLLSTLRNYWEGRRERFHGLAIETLSRKDPDAWQPYPVFYFDFNRDNYRNPGALEGVLEAHLKEWEKLYGCEDPAASLSIRFQNLLRSAWNMTGRRGVILVDEYDKPLLDVIEFPDIEQHNKAVFKGFFSTLKSFDEYIRFVFITGVTRFSKVSIFSDLNQLKDISLNADYAGICGFTEKDLTQNFSPEIHLTAETQGISFDACLELLRKTYDGYRFHQNGEPVYNPFSLLNALADREFRSYWFESGTPTFLIRKLKSINFSLPKLTDRSLYATEQMLSEYSENPSDPIPLLYQTGYLTIVDYDPRGREYTLSFPNEEVKYGFLNSLMPLYIHAYGSGSDKDIATFRRMIEAGDTEGMRRFFTALFASIPYTDQNVGFEHDFQTVIYLVFTLLGQYVHSEVHSALGRADCVVEARKFIYLFEFKRDVPAEEALNQIEEKGYALPYASDPRSIIKIGVSFDSQTRLLSDWRCEPVPNT